MKILNQGGQLNFKFEIQDFRGDSCQFYIVFQDYYVYFQDIFDRIKRLSKLFYIF